MSLYQKIIKNFLRTRRNLFRKYYPGKEVLRPIINSLLFFIRGLKKILKGKLDHKTLIEFVFDLDYLFPQKNVKIHHRKYGPQLEIKTNGFLLEFFRALDLETEKRLITQLQNAIDDLQSNLERNQEKEIEKNKKRLNKILDKLENIIKYQKTYLKTSK